MSDNKAAQSEILRDLDRVIVNMESVSHKTWTRDKRDELIWSLKILRIARKAISETLAEPPKIVGQAIFTDAESRN